MRKSDLFEPQRQSIFAIILILLKFLRSLVRQLWPILLILLFNRDQSTYMLVGLGVAVVSGLSLVASIVAYFKFYFFIRDDQLYIEKGLFRRLKVNIPFSRIQTIDFEQNVIHQFFDVVRVNIDSAGTKGNEISFDALEKERAAMLRDYILAQKAEDDDVTRTEQEAPKPAEIILRLSPSDLLKIGVSQNHLRTAGIIFAAAWALLENLSNVFGDEVYTRVQDELSMLITGSLILVLIAIPVFLLISFLLTLIRTILKYYDLRFWRTANGFKLMSGLFVRKEKSAQKSKIQIIAWSNTPVMRLFGIHRLSLYQASSVEVFGDKSITIPGCTKDQVDHTIVEVMPESEQAAFEMHGIHPLARFRFILFAGLLPCLVITVLGFLFDYTTAYWIWLYFPLSVWMGQLYYKKRKLHLHRDFVMSAKGIFNNEYKLMEIYKIQAVRLSQSFYQWRKDLATVTMYTASGDVQIPFIPISKAQQIRDYMLYRIEVDNRDWM